MIRIRRLYARGKAFGKGETEAGWLGLKAALLICKVDRGVSGNRIVLQRYIHHVNSEGNDIGRSMTASLTYTICGLKRIQCNMLQTDVAFALPIM
jgi:hypothetical protein